MNLTLLHQLPFLVLFSSRECYSFVFKNSPFVRSVSSLNVITQRQTVLWDGSELESLNQYFQAQIQPILQSQSQHGDMTKRAAILNLTNRMKIGISIIAAGTIEGTQDRVVGILKQEKFMQQLNPQEDHLQQFIQLDSESFIYKDSMAYIPSSVNDNDAIQTLMASLVGVHCVFHPTILAHVGGSLDNMIVNLVDRPVVILGGGELASFISEYVSILFFV